MIAEHNKTYIGKLRVRDSTDALTTRIRLDSAFSTLELRPSGLPKSAVVFIRKLRDPLPGLIPRELTGGLPDAWRRAVAAAIDELTRRAARPALQDVGADAESVLFLDRSELLACLAADWIHGRAIARWWWQSLFRATDVMSAVVNQWLSSIQYVPAAFAKVAQQGDAALFIGSLPTGVASKLLNELIRQFGLYELSRVTARLNRDTQQRDSGLTDDTALSANTDRLSAQEVAFLQTGLSPDIFSCRLPEPSRLLLAVALLLERAPSLLRDHGFASRLSESLQVFDSSVAGQELDAPARPQGAIAPVLDLVLRDDGLQQPRSSLSTLVDGTRSSALPGTPKKRRSGKRIQRATLSTPPREQHYSRRTGASRRDVKGAAVDFNTEWNSPRLENSNIIVEHHQPLTAETIAFQETRITATTLELAIETKLGGVFYLINAALALDLYGDFTRPLEPGIELSIWDFMALTARELIGDRIEADPVWSLLARLAGRDENKQPGTGFDPPVEWRVPTDWLKAFPETDRWSYHTSQDRLIVWHPTGFTVLDLKLGSRASTNDLPARLANETRCYSTVTGFKHLRRTSRSCHRSTPESSLDRWSRWLAGYLRVRLSRSLGISPKDNPAAMLFVRGARVEVSPARLDVFFKLDDLPVEIRLAGLDRDPGWVPAAGRAIAFHYD